MTIWLRLRSLDNHWALGTKKRLKLCYLHNEKQTSTLPTFEEQKYPTQLERMNNKNSLITIAFHCAQDFFIRSHLSSSTCMSQYWKATNRPLLYLILPNKQKGPCFCDSPVVRGSLHLTLQANRANVIIDPKVIYPPSTPALHIATLLTSPHLT